MFKTSLKKMLAFKRYSTKTKKIPENLKKVTLQEKSEKGSFVTLFEAVALHSVIGVLKTQFFQCI